jgi:hypothetical protein
MSASSAGDLMRTGFDPLLTKKIRNEYWSSTPLDTGEKNWHYFSAIFFPFGATAPILALAYLHETFCFTSVY